MRSFFLALITALSISGPPLHAQDRYQVSVSRKDRNLYKIDSKPVWVRTRYCYEYVHYEDSILTSSEIVFLDRGSKCNVAGVFEEVQNRSGSYQVSVSREDDQLYSTLEGVLFKTSMCYKYSYSEDAIYRVTGYGSGALHFLDSSTKCDVEQVLRKIRI